MARQDIRPRRPMPANEGLLSICHSAYHFIQGPTFDTNMSLVGYLYYGDYLDLLWVVDKIAMILRGSTVDAEWKVRVALHCPVHYLRRRDFIITWDNAAKSDRSY